VKYRAAISLLLLIRVGGIYEDARHFLRIRDLRPAMERWTDDEKRDFTLAVPRYCDVYKVMVYADQVNARTGEREEYSMWTTPEGYDLINKMLAERQRDGELGQDLRNKHFELSNFPADAPVFRNKHGREEYRGHRLPKAKDENRIHRLTHPLPLTPRAFYGYFSDIRIKFLGHNPKKGARGAAASVGVKLIHGLRSSGLSWMDKAKVKESCQEWLQGADLEGRRKFYLEHPESDILTEY
jgi:hypothetical protein